MKIPTPLRYLLPAVLGLAIAAAGEDTQSLPNQAGNRKVSLRGTAITDHDAVTKLMGIDLGEGYVVVDIKVTPETPEGLYVSVDDFTLISRKDGERGRAMSAHEIAGSGGLVVSQTKTRGGIGAQAGGPLGGGYPGGLGYPGGGIGGYPQSGAGVGSGGVTEGGLAQVHEAQRSDRVDPRLEALEKKILPDGETKAPVQGLLYFYMEGKVKPKNLGMVYDGQGGRLAIDFK